MTYVVTDACIRCKYMDCVAVCPTEAFREGPPMLVIDPADCIDCGLCGPECPAEAILPDIDPAAQPWIALNADHAARWPAIREAGRPPEDADDYRGMAGKYPRYFIAE